ncbi:MAG: response regulator transcription factor [Lachnospiraceae bacterium]|nr:response regulator transcription factor [Lachnospiraceae bacterium]
MSQTKILIVDDNEEIRNVLRILLQSEGYEVIEAIDGNEAISKIDSSFDLCILDVMMPGMSGYQVCEEIRKDYNLPILFLTAKSADADKSLGLLIGGDDYLVKPFSHAELTARVKSLLRRFYVYRGKEHVQHDEAYVTDFMKVNKEMNEVVILDDSLEGHKNANGETAVELSQKEYEILRLLISHPGRVFSAQIIYETIWEEPYLYSSNATIMVHIRNLRTKIEADPKNPRHILTVWGKGYKYI